MRKKLEQEIESDMQQDNYDSAIHKIDILKQHDYETYVLHIQALICYIRLNRLTDAEILCEELLARKNEHYLDYLDYYVMILYEAKKYQAVIQRINEEEKSSKLSEDIKLKFQEIKKLALQMNEWLAMELVQDIEQAVKDNEYKKQYYLIQKWRQLHFATPSLFYGFLTEETIHPVIKTLILQQLVHEGIKKEITVQKFDSHTEVIPEKLGTIQDNLVYKKTLIQLQQVEQNNPTLFNLMKEMYDQFCFVMFPFIHRETEIEKIIAALTQLVKAQFDLANHDKTNHMMKQIDICCHLYQEMLLQ